MITSSLLAFLLYFSILVLIGFVSHQKQKSATDFIVGNRSLSYWLIALSAHASDMSAWLFMGLPSAVFLFGMSQIWIPIGLIAGMWLNWTYVAKKLRVETANYECLTLSSFFEKRFQAKGPSLRVITAMMMLVYLTAYLSSGLMAMGLLLEQVFGINYYFGLGVATFVAVFYTFYGGFVTIAWTDTFQALFLIAVVVFLPLFALDALPNSFLETFAAIDKGHLLSLPPFTFVALMQGLLLMLGWGIGYFGQPHIITKFMGIKDPNEIHKSRTIGILWQTIALFSAMAIGIVGIAYFPEGLSNPELVTVVMVKGLFPPFFAAFILCAILAANISTMDSQVLVAASVVAEDIWEPLFDRGASEKRLLRVSRGAVVLVALIALAISFYKSAAILSTVFWAWSGLGASFGPLVLMALWSKRVTARGALWGILVGGVTSGLWPLVDVQLFKMAVPPLLPGFLLSYLAIIAGSRSQARLPS